MGRFVINREKAISLAEELGINVSFNAENSGVIIKRELKDFYDFFPELRVIDYSNFQLVEEVILTNLGEKILIRQSEVKRILFEDSKVNGVTILFPYLRSLVSDLTSKGSEPPIILPTINVAEMVKDIKGNFD